MHRLRVGLRLLEVLRDARLSVRALMARPLFTLTTVMTFALGIGATTVVFSLVHSVLLSPLPYREPDRLTFVQQVIPEIADRVPILGVNPRSFTSWERACQTTCEQMAALVASNSTLTGLGEPEGLIGAKISPALFDLLGIPPMLGRSFTREEDAPGRNGVAIITYGFWQRRLGADPAVIGRVLTLDSVPVEIVGVLPATFRLPQLPQLSVPNRVDNPFELFRAARLVGRPAPVVGRVRQRGHRSTACGVSVQATEAELSAITKAEYERAQIHPYAVARPLMAAVTADARRPLWLVLGAVAAALLIACVNVAGLLGARWTARQRELAIRTAMGAGRARLAQLVAIESVLLADGGRRTRARARLDVAASGPGDGSGRGAAPRRSPSRHQLVHRHRRHHAGLRTHLHRRAGVARRSRRSRRHAQGIRALDHAGPAVDRDSGLAGRRRGRADRDAARRGRVARRQLRQRPADRPRIHHDVGGRGRHRAARRALSGRAPRAHFFDALLEALGREPGVGVAGLSRALPLEGLATVDVFVPVGDARRGRDAGSRQSRAGERRILRRNRSAAAALDVC